MLYDARTRFGIKGLYISIFGVLLGGLHVPGPTRTRNAAKPAHLRKPIVIEAAAVQTNAPLTPPAPNPAQPETVSIPSSRRTLLLTPSARLIETPPAGTRDEDPGRTLPRPRRLEPLVFEL